MSKTVHFIYLFILSSIVVLVTIFLAYKGYAYYSTPLEERFYHPDHEHFKPSGLYGQGLGVIGTLLILVGVVFYLIRKRSRRMARWGRLKYWLEFHIFLCTLGPVMILFHTAFKFGGIVSIAFWSMVAVVVSGVIGRYIYIQIPRSIEGRALSRKEIQATKSNLGLLLTEQYGLSLANAQMVQHTLEMTSFSVNGNTLKLEQGRQITNTQRLRHIRKSLRQNGIKGASFRQIMRLVKHEIRINKRIERLQTMQQLFKYWHVAHMPFALVMLVIVVIHVAVTLALGYTWIF